MGRDSLYKALSGETNPGFGTVLKVARAGRKFIAVPAQRRRVFRAFAFSGFWNFRKAGVGRGRVSGAAKVYNEKSVRGRRRKEENTAKKERRKASGQGRRLVS
jgi:hypothetical protein